MQAHDGSGDRREPGFAGPRVRAAENWRRDDARQDSARQDNARQDNARQDPWADSWDDDRRREDRRGALGFRDAPAARAQARERQDRWEGDPPPAPAPRLRLGGFFPALLTAAINLAIPAVLFTVQSADRNGRAEQADYLARIAETGPPCALDLSNDNCLCSDFKTQAEAIAYVKALRHPPSARFGLYTDDSDIPCAHLPPR